MPAAARGSVAQPGPAGLAAVGEGKGKSKAIIATACGSLNARHS